MNTLDRQSLISFVNAEIVKFHNRRLQSLERLSLNTVLRRKNPYLYKAKDVRTPAEFIASMLNAFLSSAEEGCFGQFLESLAVYVSQQTSGGRKSSAPGIDIEFDRRGVRYLVAVKSGPNWGNSSQKRRLETDLRNAVAVQRQARHGLHIQPVLGSCYGKAPDDDNGLYIKMVGQSFWYFLSGDEDLYIDIIEPIGHEAHRHSEDFARGKAVIEARLTFEFTKRFCKPDYSIDWPKLVAFNSGNLAS